MPRLKAEALFLGLSGGRIGSRTPGLAALLWLVAACTSPPPAPLDRLRPVRISVRASESTREISTLSYKGGFETKTLIYETLVKRDARGRIVPALAEGWRFEDEGKECVLELRRNARFHDGSPVTPEAVREHFQRWVGLPEHDWLSCNRHIVAVRAEGTRTLRIVMDEPRALLPDLCAINPCAIRAPSTLDFEGTFVKPGPPLEHPASDNPPVWGQDARVTELVVAAQREWDETRRGEIYARIQERIDEIALLVPLYVPRRFAVLRADLPTPLLDHDLYRIDAASVAPATVVRQP